MCATLICIESILLPSSITSTGVSFRMIFQLRSSSINYAGCFRRADSMIYLMYSKQYLKFTVNNNDNYAIVINNPIIPNAWTVNTKS